MISDEMRELLSAYVDGELRDSDAARVEEMSKRDPELRREIDAYRRLGSKLRAWDDAEHGGAAPAGVARTALERALSFTAHATRARRSRLVRVVFGPVALAAAVLVAVGVGIVFGQGAPGSATAAGDRVAIEPAAPLPGHAVDGAGLSDFRAPDLSGLEERPLLSDVLVLENVIDPRSGLPMSEHALLLRELWDREIRIIEGRRHRQDRVVARESETETRRTGTWNGSVMAAVSAYEPVGAPYPAFVVLSHPQAKAGKLPTVAAYAVGEGGLFEPPDKENEDRIGFKPLDRIARLALLGEVWVSKENGRTRIVQSDAWIAGTEFVPCVWADDIRSASDRLLLEGVIVGPRLRKRLLSAGAHDDEFQSWLRQETRNKRLADVLRKAEKSYAPQVKRLMRVLEGDRRASGFSVIDHSGQVMGIELFGSHALMVAFAPRLLRGYLLEAGPKGIRLSTRRNGIESPGTQTTRSLMHDLPVRAFIEDVKEGTPKESPESLQRVNILTHSREILGHGILNQGQPVHLTIFGQ